MKIIGLTGGIASGKSTVSSFLREKGYEVVDADKIAWELTEPDAPLWQAYKERYGERVLEEDRSLNRRAVAEIVFQNPAEKSWMDSTAHPLIKKAVENKLKCLEQAGCPVVFLDVPLLYEAGWETLTELVWVVYARRRQQLRRLCRRSGFTASEAERRIDAQMSMEAKRQRGDIVIDNNASREDLQRQLKKLLSDLQRDGFRS